MVAWNRTYNLHQRSKRKYTVDWNFSYTKSDNRSVSFGRPINGLIGCPSKKKGKRFSQEITKMDGGNNMLLIFLTST